MGCDIHSIIEFKDEFGRINVFSDGQLNLPRDYRLFTFLALGEGGLTDELLFPPRGLPPDYSQTVREEFFDSADEVIAVFYGDEQEFNADELEDWAKKGISCQRFITMFGLSFTELAQLRGITEIVRALQFKNRESVARLAGSSGGAGKIIRWLQRGKCAAGFLV